MKCEASDASSEVGVEPRGEGERKSLISGVGFSDGPVLHDGQPFPAEFGVSFIYQRAHIPLLPGRFGLRASTLYRSRSTVPLKRGGGQGELRCLLLNCDFVNESETDHDVGGRPLCRSDQPQTRIVQCPSRSQIQVLGWMLFSLLESPFCAHVPGPAWPSPE